MIQKREDERVGGAGVRKAKERKVFLCEPLPHYESRSDARMLIRRACWQGWFKTIRHSSQKNKLRNVSGSDTIRRNSFHVFLWSGC